MVPSAEGTLVDSSPMSVLDATNCLLSGFSANRDTLDYRLAREMVGFHLPNILQRRTRPQTAGNSSPQTEMADCDRSQQGNQQDGSHNPPSTDAQMPPWPSRYFSSALPSRCGATRLAIASTAAACPANNVSSKSSSRNNNNNNNNNNVSRLPPSLKRKSSDSTDRTPTRNTDTPIPTIIHPHTPLHPSSSPSPPPSCPSSPTCIKSRSTRHSKPRKSILKVPTANAAAHDNELRRPAELCPPHTSQSDTRSNTSRNAILTLSYTSSQRDACPHARPDQLPSIQQHRSSLPSTITPVTPLLVVDAGKIVPPPLGNLGNRETVSDESCGNDSESGGGSVHGKGTGTGVGAGKAKSEAGVSGVSSSHSSKRDTQKNRNKKKQKMVRFDHIDVHPYEVERGEESRFRFFGRRGEGGVEGMRNEDGSVRNRGAGIEFDLDLDLREYVMDIPDVIMG